MNDEELLRYSRHLLLPELDVDGQQRLLDATVLIVGLGGLGSAAAMYLAASGIGHLVLADGDTVELSNLQRQVIHDGGTIGWPKPRSAAAAIARLNPGVRVTQCAERLDARTLQPLLADVALVLDCCDNRASRHAINRACVATGVPLLSAAALGWEGQLAVFDTRDPRSPCYACLYPEAAAREEGSCAVNGIAAPVVGAMGVLQALQALKLIAGVGDPLVGHMLVFDALAMDWHRLAVPRRSGCPVCGARD